MLMNRAEKRSQKRKEVVEAVVVRKEPISVVARVFNIPFGLYSVGWPATGKATGRH